MSKLRGADIFSMKDDSTFPHMDYFKAFHTCCSSPRIGVSGDDARVPEAAEVQPIPVVVVLRREGGKA